MDEISYNAPDQPKGTEIIIDEKFVNEKVAELIRPIDLKKFLL
jgi:ATP-dependent protease HslVU (ClpYQ) ATPase subunit